MPVLVRLAGGDVRLVGLPGMPPLTISSGSDPRFVPAVFFLGDAYVLPGGCGVVRRWRSSVDIVVGRYCVTVSLAGFRRLVRGSWLRLSIPDDAVTEAGAAVNDNC